MAQQYLLDTNVIVRFLLEDNENQLKVVNNYFERAKKGLIKLKLPLFILIETDHILRTFYNVPKSEIIDKLSKILSISYVEVLQREIIIKALTLYGTHAVDFVDCVLFAKAKDENAKILSFDQDFKKLDKSEL